MHGTGNLRGYAVEQGRSRISADLYVAKSVKGKVRFKSLQATASQVKHVSLIRIAEVIGINAAFGIQNFGKAQADFRPWRTGRLKLYPPYQVLAHVENV